MVVHVGDLLFCDAPGFRKEASQATTTFRTGGSESITKKSHYIHWDNDRARIAERHTPSQQMYADEHPIMEISGYATSKRIATSAAPNSTSQECLGSLIWTRKTRRDIGPSIAQIATQIFEACESSGKASHLTNLYGRIVKFVKNHQRKIGRSRFPKPNRDPPSKRSMILGWEMFFVADS